MAGMNVRHWRESVAEYIRTEARPEDKYGHQPRLYALACRLGEDTDYDDEVVFAAAWMHDLGVFLGHRPTDPKELARWNHAPYTIERSSALLLEWGFLPEKLAAVAEAIRTHQPQDDPVTTEAILLRDADILEQLGAIGVLRAVVKVGRDTRYPTYSAVIPALRRALELLPPQLRLERSQAMAKPKIAALQSFLDSVEAEAGDLLY